VNSISSILKVYVLHLSRSEKIWSGKKES